MRNVAVAVIGTIGAPLVLHILIPYLVLRQARESFPDRLGPLEVVSFALATLGLAMVVWVSITFVRRGQGTAAPMLPPRNFVAGGLFRFVRNPMYIGLLLVIVAEAIFFRSVGLLLYAASLWLVVHGFVVLVEEPQLRKRFGGAYDDYCVTVPRWLPRLRGRPAA